MSEKVENGEIVRPSDVTKIESAFATVDRCEIHRAESEAVDKLLDKVRTKKHISLADLAFIKQNDIKKIAADVLNEKVRPEAALEAIGFSKPHVKSLMNSVSALFDTQQSLRKRNTLVSTVLTIVAAIVYTALGRTNSYSILAGRSTSDDTYYITYALALVALMKSSYLVTGDLKELFYAFILRYVLLILISSCINFKVFIEVIRVEMQRRAD